MTTSVAVPIVVDVLRVATSVMAKAVRTLYGIADDINDYLDKHIEEMKTNDNATIARTGRVLEAAKYGFGMGYVSSVVIIATGQLLLGNTLAAIGTAITAVTLTNPIAMTCAAVGAVYYGWYALSDRERDEILERLGQGLAVGIELIKSVVRYTIDKTKELLSPKNIDEIKKYIGSAAALFGQTLGDVTHKLSDVFGDTFEVVKRKTGQAVDKTIDVATEGYREVAECAETAADKLCERFKASIHKTVPDNTAAPRLVDQPIGILPQSTSAITLELSEQAGAAPVQDARSK